MLNNFLKFACLSTAFHQVKENHGCAGVDGVTITEFENDLQKNLAMLENELRQKTYSPLPLLKILVDKGNGEARALSVPAVRDRVAQTDVECRLNLSKIILRGKITNCLNIIRSFSYNHPQIDFSGETNEIKKYLNSIVTGTDINSLMGIEGIVAKIYFTAFGKMILKEFTFFGRKKHPSTDPVNALLSFGYTLVFNEIMSLLDGLGFDPYLGYFHSAEYGRASLASDLQEEFRAVVDRFTLYLINDGIFKKDDFYVNPKAEGIYLKRESMKRYFEEYERYFASEFKHPETSEKTTFRKCFRIQAEKLANYIKGGSAYTPFLLQV